jgi:hypothetical protein
MKLCRDMHLLFLIALASVSCAGLAHAEDATAASTLSEVQSAYAQPNIQHGPYGEVRIVVPLTTDDVNIQKMKLRNVTNSLKAGDAWNGKFTVSFVIYAKGVSLLRNPDESTQRQIDALKEKGVKFQICDNTLKEQGLDFHMLYHVVDADIVPSGFAEVAYLQANEHYVVVPGN